MLASQIPTKVPLPFANAGTKNTIPTAASPTPGLASLTLGFPPLTFTPLASGGVPPEGADFNGILNLITAVQQWQCAGGGFKYDATFSTAIGGYPKGAILANTAGDGYWLNLADSNTTDPNDQATSANWGSAFAYGISAVTGLTNANVTLSAAQYGRPVITFAGTLTGNVQIIFPTSVKQWLVVNNTTGAFTLTCKTAAGTGAAITNDGAPNMLYGDGTNIASLSGISQTAADARYAALAGLLTQVFRVATPVGANDAVPLGEFVGLNSASGYIKLPMIVAGTKRTLIIQWAYGTGGTPSDSSQQTITLPITFPNAVLFAFIATQLNAHGVGYSHYEVLSKTTSTVVGYCISNTADNITPLAISIGW